MYKYIITIVSIFWYTNTLIAQPVDVAVNKVQLTFSITNQGVPQYQLFYKGKQVIQPSNLGFVLQNQVHFDKYFKILSIDSAESSTSWQPVWGEVNTIYDHHKQLTVQLQQQVEPFLKLNIVFRVFADGIGFRYEFPLQPNAHFMVINSESTQFALTNNHQAFWIPGDYDSNEYPYTFSTLSEVNAWKFPMISNGQRNKNIPDSNVVQTPLQLKTTDGLYINIHEAALVNFSSMQLHIDKSNYALQAHLVPDADGNRGYVRTPSTSPWRTIIVSDKATDILASKLILNLNQPSKITNTKWIRPMKFMGVWWEMQTGRSSWSYTNHSDSLDKNGQLIPHGKHAAHTKNVIKYIDFAAKWGIKGLLIEGWNKGWEEWTGVWKENNFDYVTPYPDFDIKAITAYAQKKGVQLIMHNETGGSVTNFERHMDTAFRFMNKNGYHSVKTGYVGKIIPNGEHHDGQWMVLHYERVAQNAANYQVMVDMHEPVRPTGLHRTYPNWMACEAGRGNEWNAFSNGNDPNHETILPFTRLMGGPMDYTPGIFKLRNYAKDAPQRQMHSTLAKQLALYVTIYSPVQMVADIPENYLPHLDAFKFIQEVPVDWADTKILEAEPGEFVTIARKDKLSENWFVGGITGDSSRNAFVHLGFLNKGQQYIATIYADAPNAHWKSNPEAYQITKQTVNSESNLQIFVANGGGFAISIKPVIGSKK